jgi:hypothetical protein
VTAASCVSFSASPAFRRAIDDQAATDQVHIGDAAFVERMFGLLAFLQDAGVDGRILVNQHGTLAAVARGDQAQLARLLSGVKCFSS